MDITIKHISASDCLDLRSRILRPGQNIELCHYAEDNLSSSFHLGALDSQSGKILANGTFMKNAHTHFSAATNPYRLRGMATDPDYRGLRLGSRIIASAEMLLRSLNCDLLWFNARESAFTFYEKNDYLYSGEVFDIAGIGPHKVMYKWL